MRQPAEFALQLPLSPQLTAEQALAARLQFVRQTFFSASGLGAAALLSACGGGAPWHGAPDGGATFAAPDGGWVYVSNAELAFNSNGSLAGGLTPWGTWLSCEEYEFTVVQADGFRVKPGGQVSECDPFKPWVGGQKGINLLALGSFSHKAVCVNPVGRTPYLTEDVSGSRAYRFVCAAADWPAGAARPAMRQGKLQVMQVEGISADVDPPVELHASSVDLRNASRVQRVDAVKPEELQGLVRSLLRAVNSTPPGSFFPKAEGMWFHNGIVFFATSRNHRIWAYHTQKSMLEIIYSGDMSKPDVYTIHQPDNITVTSFGDVLVSEDAGNLEIGVIRSDGTSQAVMRLMGHDSSELIGPAIPPDCSRLYFSSQHGTTGKSDGGMTFEVMLPKA